MSQLKEILEKEKEGGSLRAACCGQPAMWVPPTLKTTATTSLGVKPNPRILTTGAPTDTATATVIPSPSTATCPTAAITASPTI